MKMLQDEKMSGKQMFCKNIQLMKVFLIFFREKFHVYNASIKRAVFLFNKEINL